MTTAAAAAAAELYRRQRQTLAEDGDHVCSPLLAAQDMMDQTTSGSGLLELS